MARNSSAAPIFTLTRSQMAFLKDRMQAYRNKKPSARPAYARKVAGELKEDLEEITEGPLSQERQKALRKAVARWFVVNFKYEKGPHKRPWGIRWHTRLVFQYERSRAILYVAKMLAENKPLPNLRTLLDKEESIIPPDAVAPDQEGYLPDDNEGEEDDEDEGNDQDEAGAEDYQEEELEEEPEEDDSRDIDEDSRPVPPTPPVENAPKPFYKYQPATSLLMKTLTAEETAYYERKAAVWRQKGPPREEQRRVAQRFLSSRLYDFVISGFNDMNARFFILYSYEKPDGTRLALPFDYNKELGGCEESFMEEFEELVAEAHTAWGNWAGGVYAAQKDSDSNRTVQKASSKVSKSRTKPLMTMELYGDGTPILPPLAARPYGITPQIWLAAVFRSFFTRHLILAKSTVPMPEVDPLDRARPELNWGALAQNFSECIRKDIIDPVVFEKGFKDPLHMSTQDLHTLHKILYSRQQDDSVDIDFRFEKYPVRLQGGRYKYEPSRQAKEESGVQSDGEIGDYSLLGEEMTRRHPRVQVSDHRWGRIRGRPRSPSSSLPEDVGGFSNQRNPPPPPPRSRSSSPEDVGGFPSRRNPPPPPPRSRSSSPEDVGGFSSQRNPPPPPPRSRSSSPEDVGGFSSRRNPPPPPPRSRSSSPEDVGGFSSQRNPPPPTSRSRSSSPEDVGGFSSRRNPPPPPPRSRSSSPEDVGGFSSRRNPPPPTPPPPPPRSRSSSPEDVGGFSTQRNPPPPTPTPPPPLRSRTPTPPRSRSSSPEDVGGFSSRRNPPPPTARSRSSSPEEVGVSGFGQQRGEGEEMEENRGEEEAAQVRPPSRRGMMLTKGLSPIPPDEVDAPRTTRAAKRARNESEHAADQAKRSRTMRGGDNARVTRSSKQRDNKRRGRR
ncbi:hypothetical protein CC1G_10664 [Coprinopsis cinerea okayama7|uniref:Uncharacterized protein n=1 Tax=Coprinopsis cinerea (strain Okayama-7 / 130 / ATCC MYA-4618 / FGSC 9003) TaxID=240176 RepID=A8NDN8_COPC7|nr:hypothetical protein CC1G_10664 [Coprinopsis cinerea okayama7\|eukprot:XP_001832815.2 hypothetical protein CC1G_10664 [Coprinopsis cinerea okayama7\